MFPVPRPSRLLALLVLLSVLPVCPAHADAPAAEVPGPLDWPEVTRETRPWARWWWLGSAVDKVNLTRQLTLFQQAGLGGVEICPIYGAKGYEDHFIDFLSPKWMEMLAHTIREAGRLGLGVDLTTGTGWPFGGPFVSPEDASSGVILKSYNLTAGGTLAEKLPDGHLQCLMAISEQGEQIDLTARVRDGRLDWTAPAGLWRLYCVIQSGPVQKVKRAAPGGEGEVLDPYSVKAMDNYLAVFDRAFALQPGIWPRAQFHDSFEYFGANWTAGLFDEFARRGGYDLRTQLPALFGEGAEDTVARVKYDYRATIAYLHQAYMQRWKDWAHAHGGLARDQAHGAPCNLIDLYATADIPETEIFGSVDERNVVMNKFSSSAAHLAGRHLASAESFTWLNEPFQATWSQVKQAADYLFLTGVNHIFYHGIPYSPAEAPWPGWQFYAAVNFGPDGGLWRDLPEFNAYATRCQSVLQSGAPANDVLLYFPLADLWQVPADLVLPLTMHNIEQALGPHPFHADALTLWQRGYGYDLVSDRFLTEATAGPGEVNLASSAWRAVLVPECRLMPESTLRHLIELARGGALVLFHGNLPVDVPGLGGLAERRTEFKELIGSLDLKSTADGVIQKATVGQGAFLIGADLDALLRVAGVAREPAVDLGLRVIRRHDSSGFLYFLANRSDHAVDGWVTLGTKAESAAILDPRYVHRTGVAALRQSTGSATEVYLQLQPGESCFLRTFSKKVEGLAWTYAGPAGRPQPVVGTWQVQFVDGGPALPAGYEATQLTSWTARDDPETKRFAGMARYTIEFDRPAGEAEDWLLDLGRVCESARVKLNGREAGAFWCAPFRAAIGEWFKPGKNFLEIEVTNLAANRIRDLDQRKVNWKYFYDANVLSRNYRPLDASNWPLFDSGLLGPVTLTPLKRPAL